MGSKSSKSRKVMPEKGDIQELVERIIVIDRTLQNKGAFDVDPHMLWQMRESAVKNLRILGVDAEKVIRENRMEETTNDRFEDDEDEKYGQNEGDRKVRFGSAPDLRFYETENPLHHHRYPKFGSRNELDMHQKEMKKALAKARYFQAPRQYEDSEDDLYSDMY